MLCESFSSHFLKKEAFVQLLLQLSFQPTYNKIIIRIKPILSNIIGTLGLSTGKANKYNFNNKVPT